MMERVKDICFYLVIGFALTLMSRWLESGFLKTYLAENIVTILIALLAINTTTSSVVMTKLKDIYDKTGSDFSLTINELRGSIIEQILFIVIAIFVLILSDSKIVMSSASFMSFFIDCLLASLFAGGLHALFDTASAIFVILRYENKT